MRLFTTFVFMSMLGSITAQEELLLFKKGACMGKCPIYEVAVSKDGLMRYSGKRFVEEVGIYERMLTKKEFRKLKKKLRKAKFHRLEEEYGARIMDAQQTLFTYHGKKGTQTVKVKLEAPKKLQALDEYVVSLSPLNKETDPVWTKVEVKKKRPVGRRGELIGRVEQAGRTLIVELKPEVVFEEWVQNYSSSGVRLSKRIAPNRPLYLIQFDERRANSATLLKRFKQDPQVVEAQTNQSTSPR